MKLIKFIIVSLICLLPFSLLAMDHSKPQMLKDKFYKEYWEQHFLFEDGTFITSQFLVANFPWPVGRDHGIMISTVVSPDGKRTIIKNGRNFGKWGFDTEKFDLFIHTHRLKSTGNKHDIHVGTVGRNVIDITGSAAIPPLDHQRHQRKKDYMETSFYLPYFKGDRNWRVQYDEKQPFEVGKGKVQGFGTHVIFNGRVEGLLQNWLRISGLSSVDDASDKNRLVPFLSAQTRSDGRQDSLLTLKNAANDVISFSDITLTYKNIIQATKKSSYPTVIEITAKNDTGSLTGTIRFTRKIDHFNIMDHLNFFERTFAKSRASIANYRYIADYDFSYVTAEGTQKITGKALSEYKDILSPKKKKKKRRR
ncbi:MAG: hypothetical protein JKY59_08890 [Emcibacter sp.]|nr:hypothetical protein [Emcibacter sp.]